MQDRREIQARQGRRGQDGIGSCDLRIDRRRERRRLGPLQDQRDGDVPVEQILQRQDLRMQVHWLQVQMQQRLLLKQTGGVTPTIIFFHYHNVLWRQVHNPPP